MGISLRRRRCHALARPALLAAAAPAGRLRQRAVQLQLQPSPVSPRPPPATPKSRAGRRSKFAVAAANPLATDAGYQVLKAGGSAIDAAIAVQMVLTLVEPQSSGIGGGAFLLHYNGREVEAFDGRETAPAAADEKLFLGADGKPWPSTTAWSAAARSACRAPCACWRWRTSSTASCPGPQLFEPAIALAEGGFKVSPRLNTLAQGRCAPEERPDGRSLLLQAPTASRWTSGPRCATPNSPTCCATSPPRAPKRLHEGEIAQAIVDKVQKHPTNPGQLTLADLAGYQPKKRDADLPRLPRPGARTTASAAFRRPAPARSPSGRSWASWNTDANAATRCRWQDGPALRRLAAPVHRSGAPGFCRPRPVPGRPRLRAAARPAAG